MNSTPSLTDFRLCRRIAIVAAASGWGLLAGCVHHPIIVQTPAPTVIQTPAAAPAQPPPMIVVNQAPPAPLQDTMAPQPSPQDVWIPGYWAWRNNQQQWIQGHWEIPPHPGATWVPARWEQNGNEYEFVDGYWQ